MKTLAEGLSYLVDERRIISGISLAYGDLSRHESVIKGLSREVKKEGGAFAPAPAPLSADSVFDLASVTKLFTCVSILQLCERGRLSLSDPVRRYAPMFSQLHALTVYDLLAFQTGLSTRERVDAQPDRESALAALFTLSPAEKPERRFYTDMGAMALKYVIEGASGLAYETWLSEHVFLPLGMESTFSRVPESRLPDTVCYNYERRIVDGNFWMDEACEPGTVHDYKARVLDSAHDLCGHAGLFSTLPDMVRFAEGLLSGALLSRDTLLEMGKNRTGHPLPGGGYCQYLGYLCFCKHPDQTFSEVPRCFGERTVALNGFCGNHFSVDPEQNRFIVLLSNRIHNRVTMTTGRANPREHMETLRWDDGKDYVVSQNYVYCKDENIKDPIGRIFEAAFPPASSIPG